MLNSSDNLSFDLGSSNFLFSRGSTRNSSDTSGGISSVASGATVSVAVASVTDITSKSEVVETLQSGLSDSTASTKTKNRLLILAYKHYIQVFLLTFQPSLNVL